nr:unnamed protein product [Digitaria exilis]
MSSTKRGGGGRHGRGRGRGRGAVVENDMDRHETSSPSSPSTTSDREENAILIPRQSPACYVGPSELSSTLLNPKINHRSDAIFGDQVDKLEGMVKRAKRAMSSTADTTTQALVAEFLHGFQDVVQDITEIDTSPHIDTAASQQSPELVLEAEQNIDANQEDQQEDEINTVEHASLTLEPMDEENNLSNNVLSDPSLGLDETCDSGALATENYDTITAATDLIQPSAYLQQDEHLEDHPEMEQTIFMVEPKCEEDDDSNFVLPSSPPEIMLEEQDNSANPDEEHRVTWLLKVLTHVLYDRALK